MVSVGALVLDDNLCPSGWLTESITSFGKNVGSLVSVTFGAYARVFHPAHHGGELVSWAQVARANRKIVHSQMQFTRLIGYESRYSPDYKPRQSGVFDEAPAVGELPADVAASLAHTLARHTATAADCWFAVWGGWGDLDEAFHGHLAFDSSGHSWLTFIVVRALRGSRVPLCEGRSLHDASTRRRRAFRPGPRRRCRRPRRSDSRP